MKLEALKFPIRAPSSGGLWLITSMLCSRQFTDTDIAAGVQRSFGHLKSYSTLPRIHRKVNRVRNKLNDGLYGTFPVKLTPKYDGGSNEAPPAKAGLTKADVDRLAEELLREIDTRRIKAIEKLKIEFAVELNNMEEKLSTAPDVNVTIKRDGKKAVTYNTGKQHKSFALLLQVLGAGQSAFMVGPAGSGKTYAAHQAADALKLKFYAQSVCSQTGAHVLQGYHDANGRYVRSMFRDAYEKGGIFLLDEIDAGNPNVISVLNAALANGQAAFPDKMVNRHKDFIAVAAGNTYGRGADRQYVGRNQMDAASLDRFVIIDWDYDEALERDMTDNKTWCRYVQKIRAAIAHAGKRHVVSPRATMQGSALLAIGIDREKVEDMVIWKGLKADEKAEVKRHVRA